MIKIFLFKLNIVLFCVVVFVADNNAQNIVQKFDNWKKIYPQEKVYIHFNQSFFLMGDTMYCKAYVVNADRNIPSSISSIVYVDVIDNTGKVLKTIFLPLANGIGWGGLAINNLLHEGEYNVRAYTNWMRNFNADFFYEKKITIISPASSKKVSSALSKPLSIHKFYLFPEGGQMVVGLPARIAFKALGTNGLGITAAGKILDENNTLVVTFKTGFGGMGSCTFTPLHQHTYTAVVQYNDGFEEKQPLLTAETNGYAFAINNTDEKKFSITVTEKGKGDDIIIVGQSNNKIQYSAKLKLINGTITQTVSKERFPTGVAQFTLFTGDAVPVAERLVFVNHNDQLNIHTSLTKAVYGKREKVKLTLHVTDNLDQPVNGSFSIAVTDGNIVPSGKPDEHSITTNLLLTSDLKGYIENPTYYFTDVDSNKVRDLDNLLLTQGWRRFSWKEIVTNHNPSILYQAEKSLALTGKIIGENKEPTPDASVTLLSKNKSGYTLQTKTDSAGDFIFDNLKIIDAAQFVLQAIGKDGSKNVIVTANTFSPPPVNNTLPGNSTSIADSSLEKYILANNKRWEDKKHYGLISEEDFTLKEVTVTTTKLSKVRQAVAPSANLNGPGNADQVLTYDDIQNCHDLTKCLPGKLTGVRFVTVLDNNGVAQTKAYSASGQTTPMLIILDGMDMPAGQSSVLTSIPAGDVQSIEVLRSGAYLSAYGTRAAGGVLIITTKKGDIDYNHLDDKKMTDKNILFIKLSGYTSYREFYAPDYSMAASENAIPDLRSTIHWQPDIVTDEDGNATVEWYNAGITGKYNVIVEGISDNGRTGNSSFSYEVK